MSTGTKHDGDKPKLHLFPMRALLSMAEVMTWGAHVYGEYNWQEVEPFEERYFSALLRHLIAWRLGELKDPNTGLPHLAHAGCNVVFLLSKQLGLEGPSKKADEPSLAGVF